VTPEAGSWRPANAAERAMARAAAEGDRREYFRVLATADLYLPRLLDDAAGEQRFVTATLFDQTFLLVFTSVEAMARQVEGVADGYTVTSYQELRQKWPRPTWRLAVNLGSPLDAYAPVDAIAEAAAGQAVVPTMAELMVQAAQDENRVPAAGRTPPTEAVDDVDAALLDAAQAGDVHGYLAVLLDAAVLVPTEREVADPNEILDPGFPWRRTGPADRSVIEVFTSADALARAHPGAGPAVTVALPFALAVWPQGCGLSVNPGSRSGIELPHDQVLWLLLWGQADGDEPAS
jgi:hypothetical protein